jgi:DNA-directed RNA polymerase subunit beta'
VEGLAIRLHPLSCAAFNADFDGDQMAVHVPLSAEAQVEARMLMLGSRNILKPASGEPVITPSHDIVIGVYYLTKPMGGVPGEGMVFTGREEVIGALDSGKVDYHAKIKIRGINRIVENGTDGEPRKPAYWKDYTTPGQVVFNEIVPEGMGFIMANGQIPHEKIFGKKGLSSMVSSCHQNQGAVACAVFLDNLKSLGFHYSTVSGLTVGMEDMIIPEMKSQIVAESKRLVADVEDRVRKGELTEAERYNRIIDIWSKATEDVKKSMMDSLERDKHGFNPIFMMAHSGARGSVDQIRQLAGMRGLMSKPKKKLSGELGETIETPILSSLKEGLSVIEYSISTHGSRKGLADTALKTADAGYLTRRLVDVCQDVVITINDCGTIRGRNISALKEGEEVLEPLRDRISGRVTAEDVFDPVGDEIILEAGEEITSTIAARIEEIGIETVRIRSVLTCEADHGLCAKCYGWDLSRNRMVTRGEAVGVIAAQSIGEPGTQLTLRTFHTGGVAGREAKETEVRSRRGGTVSFRNIHLVEGTDEAGKTNRIATRNGQVVILDERGDAVSTYDIVPGSILNVNEDQQVARDELICRSDPFILPIVSEQNGSVHYVDIEEEITLREEIDSEQRRQMVIVEDRSRTLHPHLFILPENLVVLSGRPQRRDRELRTLNELLKESNDSGGRMVFTYRDVGSVRNTSLLEDFTSGSDINLPCVRVDCRKVHTGSYAAFVDAVGAMESFGKAGGALWKKLKAVTETLAEAPARNNDELEQEFIDALLAFSAKVPFILSIADLNRGHTGTRKVVQGLCDSIGHGRMLLIASFSRRGLRSHTLARGKQRQQDQDPVEEFIKDSIQGVYPIPSGAHLRVEDGALVRRGAHLARIERRLGQQRDITGGLPRVEELVEARCPMDSAAIAEISGVVTLSPIKAAMRTITIRGDQGQESSLKIAASKHIRVREGDLVEAGDKLTEGPLDPHDILRVRGTEAVEEYLLNEVQEVYRLQGVKINDKHVGIVVRQMLSKARIEDPGDTRFLEGSQVDRLELNRHNMEVMRQGKRPATSDVQLLGITKASLATDSFLSAASFQETNTVLADAAVHAKVDPLIGLKENVIVGHVIPAGTGLKMYHNVKLFLPDGEAPPEPVRLEREEDTLDKFGFDA